MSISTIASARRGPTGNVAKLSLIGLGLVILLGAVAANSASIAALALTLVIATVSIRAIESWPVLLTGLLLVIFLIPIRRYTLPGNLPFDVEPYRIVVFALTLIWVAALLVDRSVQLRRSALDVPLLALLLSVLLSVSTSIGYLERLAVVPDAVKAVSFFISFLFVYFIITTVIRSREQIERQLRAIVGLAAFVSVMGIIEFRTGFNVFNHLTKIAPFLQYSGDIELDRAGQLRTYASAQHPIALAGMLAMIFPLALYLAQTSRRVIWWAAAFLIGLGALATLSRTGVVAILAAGITLLVLRPLETKQLLPLIVPALVVVFFALPNALGTFKGAFFPQGGIVAEQSEIVPENQLYSNNRLADIGPSLHEWRGRPLFGHGYGSRIVERGPRQNAAILDDQWLQLLLETGLAGFVALLWVIVRAARRLGRLARSDPSATGLLAGSLAAAIVSYGVGIVTYDGFSFIQATLLFFIVLGLASCLLAADGGAGPPALGRDGEAAMR